MLLLLLLLLLYIIICYVSISKRLGIALLITLFWILLIVVLLNVVSIVVRVRCSVEGREGRKCGERGLDLRKKKRMGILV